MKASLTLSGGAALGLAHIGALKILEYQFDFDYYAGVSAGAIVTAAHACGYSADKISEIVHSQNIFSLIFDFSRTNYGIVQGQKVYDLMSEVFANKTFEDIAAEGKQLVIYATDFTTGERVSLRSGDIANAVMASISIPVFFEPFEYGEQFLVDGGISGNFPMQDTLDLYKGKCVGIDVATSIDTTVNFRKKSFFGKTAGLQAMAERSIRIMFSHQQTFNEEDPRLLLFRPDLTGYRGMDVKKMKQIETIGHEMAYQYFYG